MRPTETIERIIRETRADVSAKMDRNVHERIDRALAEVRNNEPGAVGLAVWRRIMKSKVTWLTAAAVIVMAAVVMWPEGGITSRAYAITELPQLMREARTLHMKGWTYAVTGEDGEQTKVPMEYWADFETMRSRWVYYSYGFNDNEPTIEISENIVNGEYLMEVNHSGKTAEYKKMSDFDKALMAYMNFDNLCKLMFDTLQKLGDFAQTGDEALDGVVYQVWEGEYSVPEAGAAIRAKSWFDPIGGNLGRFTVWTRRGDEEWRAMFELEKVERNIEIADEVFALVLPEGYELLNSKETADEFGVPQFGSASYGDLSVTLNISFTLGDGSVVVCWTCGDSKDDGAIAKAFDGLKVGGELPELPVVVAGLQAMSRKGLGAEYVGRHLAYMRKGDSFYEWGIYVRQNGQEAEEPAAYNVITKINREEAREHWNIQLLVPAGFVVDTDKKFERLVLGGMAHHDESGTARMNMTYEDVLKLAEQIRGSTVQ